MWDRNGSNECPRPASIPGSTCKDGCVGQEGGPWGKAEKTPRSQATISRDRGWARPPIPVSSEGRGSGRQSNGVNEETPVGSDLDETELHNHWGSREHGNNLGSMTTATATPRSQRSDRNTHEIYPERYNLFGWWYNDVVSCASLTAFLGDLIPTWSSDLHSNPWT